MLMANDEFVVEIIITYMASSFRYNGVGTI